MKPTCCFAFSGLLLCSLFTPAVGAILPYYPFYKKEVQKPGYLNNSIIRPLRFGSKPYHFNRLNLASHELLVFEVKSVTTEIAPESIIPPEELKALDDQANKVEVADNQEESVVVPQVDPEVISTRRTQKLDAEAVIPLLLRFQENQDDNVTSPLFLNDTNNASNQAETTGNNDPATPLPLSTNNR